MIEFLNNLDTSIFLAVNGAHSPFFDTFMTMFTGRFIWIPMYAMVLWILFKSCRWQTATAYLVALVCAILLTDQTCASVIRPAVERLRPSNLENTLSDYAYIVNGYRGGSYGFPSCHAANSFALAVVGSLFGLACYYAARFISSRMLGETINGGVDINDSSVTLKQLTPGATLDSLTPTPSLLREISTVTTTRIAASDMMIAAFALTLAVIVIASALH